MDKKCDMFFFFFFMEDDACCSEAMHAYSIVTQEHMKEIIQVQ